MKRRFTSNWSLHPKRAAGRPLSDTSKARFFALLLFGWRGIFAVLEPARRRRLRLREMSKTSHCAHPDTSAHK